MYKLSIAVATLALIASNAMAVEFTVTNHSDDTIYSLYAWPTDLTAHTLNLLGYPLSPGSDAQIDIDNSYDECLFTFETDANAPVDKKKNKKLFIPRKNIELRGVNICLAAGKFVIPPQSDGL